MVKKTLRMDNKMNTVSGLILIPDFISPEEEKSLLHFIDQGAWTTPSITGKGRRVQHYGRRYNYTSKSASSDDSSAPPIPDQYFYLLDRLEPYHSGRPSQLIINEYLRTQGIASHIDSTTFGPVITTISLGDEAIMSFKNSTTGEVVDVPLHPRSAVLMTGDSRYVWSHEIPRKIGYICDGKNKKRGQDWRRVSLTFRTIS